MRNAAKQAMKWLFNSGVVLGVMLAAGVAQAALVTVSGSETWDGVLNPHSADGVTLSQAGGVSTYTIPNGMTIGTSGVIGLGTVNSNVTLSFAPSGGGLTLNGQINVSSGFRGTGPVRTFTLAMNNNSITGSGDILSTYLVDNTQDKHDLSITGTGNVSFDDIDFRHSDGGPGGNVDINVGGSVTLDTVNTSDDSSGGGAAENVTIRGSAVTVGAISAFAARTATPAQDNGNVTIEALAYPGFNPNDNVNNTMNNIVTLTGAIDVEGSATNQGGGNVTIRGVVVNLGAGFTCEAGSVNREADSTLSIRAGKEPPTGWHFLDASSDATVYLATYDVDYVHPLRESQTFDSAASAAYNGWVAVDGDGPSNSDGGADLLAGWSGTEVASSELAGVQTGEGRVRGSRSPTTLMTYYADTTLGTDFTFSDAFAASGRMDFNALSGKDYIGTGFTLGFFDRRAVLSAGSFNNANYLAVGFSFNHDPDPLVSMVIVRSDASGSVTCYVASATTLGVSVGNDLLFAFRYDPTAGANGQGRLSGTITDASSLGVTSFSIDLTAANRTALAGGVLNSFGLVKPRATAPQAGYADWHFDDVTYGVPEPPRGTMFVIR